MGKNIGHLQHVKSNVVLEGKPKLPQSGVLVEGELAVNYSDGYETISLENTNNEIVTFSSDEYYTKQKLGSAFTDENSAVTVTSVIESNERVISSSLNDLNSRKLDASAYTPTDLSNYYTKSETSGKTEISNALSAKVNSATYTGHTADTSIHFTTGVVQTQIDNSISGKVNTSDIITAITASNSGSTNPIAAKVVAENELIVSNALNDLEERKLDASAYTPSVELWVSGSGENAVSLKGGDNTASGKLSVAEGSGTTASGSSSHAEGQGTHSNGEASHAEGAGTTASANQSHAEGSHTTASGNQSHAEGAGTTASGYQSHAEGLLTTARGNQSHAEGAGTIASGNQSHAEGSETIASNASEHASGQYNVSNSATTEFGDSGNTLFSVGNGTSVTQRHNAFEIRQNGDIYIVNKDGNDVRLQDELGNITVDQVLDNTTSASTNPVSSKAVYDAITDNEFVWANAYAVISGAISSHTVDSSIHVTSADRDKLNSITGNVGTMAYEDKTSYSSATEVNTALADKIASGDVVTAITSSNSGSSAPVSVKVVAENELIVSNALNDLEERKLDASAYTPTDLSNYYMKSETSGATEIQNALDGKLDATAYTPTDLSNYYTKSQTSGATELSTAFSAKANTATTLAGYGITDAYTKTYIDDKLGTGFTVSSITEVIKEDERVTSEALNDLNTRIGTGFSSSSVTVVMNSKADKTEDLDGVKLRKITQSAYDALVQAGTVDPNTLYIITDNNS